MGNIPHTDVAKYWSEIAGKLAEKLLKLDAGDSTTVKYRIRMLRRRLLGDKIQELVYVGLFPPVNPSEKEGGQHPPTFCRRGHD